MLEIGEEQGGAVALPGETCFGRVASTSMAGGPDTATMLRL
jgi:hypothetical protein